MAMAVKQHDVKVKFIETHFISSDAASFKSVVQRLTGKHSSPAPSHVRPGLPQPQRPRPCRSAFAGEAGTQQQQEAGYWAHEQSGNGHHHLTMPAPKQEPQHLEELYELCDFSDLLYATGGVRRDGSFPYC